MIRTRPLRWLSVGIAFCVVVGFIVLLIVSGTLIASGELWDVDRASDLEIGTGQQQIITNIEVLESNEPVEIYVGDIVESGADLDPNATSYWVDGKKETRGSDVYIRNPNSSNATIVVSSSAISSAGRFDVKIDNIDTTNVSRYAQNGSKINRDISYIAEQGGKKAIVDFNITSSTFIEFKSNTYNESTQSISYNSSIDDNLSSNLSVTVWEEKHDGSLGKRIKTVPNSGENISLKNTSLEGETRLIIGIHSPSNKHGLDTIYDLDKAIVNVTVPPQVVSGPFYYIGSKEDGQPSRTLLLEFNTNISRSKGYVKTKFSNNNTINIHLSNQTNKYNINGKLLYVYLNVDTNNLNQHTQPEIDNLLIKNITSTTSSVQFENLYSSPVRLGTLIADSGKFLVDRGSDIGFYFENQGVYTISKRGENVVRRIDSTGSIRTHTLDTGGLNSSFYSLNSSSGAENATIKLLDSTISLEATDTVDGSPIPIDIGATGTKRTAVLSVSNPNSTEIHREELVLNNSSNTSRFVSVSQPGSYKVRVNDLNTNSTSTQIVDVADKRSPRIYINDQDQPASGDYFNPVLNSTYNQSLVNLTTPNNSTIILKLTTSDRGPTPVTLNTYASPDSPSKFVETGTGVSVESVTGDTDPLPPGTYDLTLRSGHGSEVGNDTATVTVEPRSTNGLTAYVTGDVAPDEFENATEIRTAIADGTLAPATTVNANDTVVYAVNATGLTGLAETANASLDRGADLDRLEGVSFGVAPTEDDGNDSTDDALGPTLNGSAVHLDRNGLYLVADGERAFGTETSPDPGRTFEAAFRVDDERLRRTAADDRHRVTTELTYGAEDSIDGSTVNEAAVDSTDASTSDGSGPTASSGSSGGSGATGTGGSAGGSAATGGGGGPSGPVDVGNAAGAGGRTRPGPAANRSGPRPGVGISIAPGTSEIPPSAGPAELFGVGAYERGADAAAAAGSGSADGVSNGDPGGTSDGVTPAEPTDPAASADSPEPSAADDGSADGADASDLGYEDAPIRSTVYDLPGFDVVASLAAVAGASLLARRRGRGP